MDTTVHVHVPYPRIGEYLPLIKEKQFDLEIYFPAAALDTLKTSAIEQLRKELAYNPSLSFHAPFMDLSPGAMDSKVRAATIERFSHIFDIAEILSPKAIVFHSGYDKWRYDHNTNIWLEKSLETWKPLIERAARLGIKIVIENIFEDEPSNLNLLMKEIHSENFGLCFDTGHFNLFSKTPLEHWLESLAPYIYEFHIHDNDKSMDQHLPIGEGTFDFSTLFSNLDKKKSYIYTIEAHTPERVLKSLSKLKEFV